MPRQGQRGLVPGLWLGSGVLGDRGEQRSTRTGVLREGCTCRLHPQRAVHVGRCGQFAVEPGNNGWSRTPGGDLNGAEAVGISLVRSAHEVAEGGESCGTVDTCQVRQRFQAVRVGRSAAGHDVQDQRDRGLAVVSPGHLRRGQPEIAVELPALGDRQDQPDFAPVILDQESRCVEPAVDRCFPGFGEGREIGFGPTRLVLFEQAHGLVPDHWFRCGANQCGERFQSAIGIVCQHFLAGVEPLFVVEFAVEGQSVHDGEIVSQHRGEDLRRLDAQRAVRLVLRDFGEQRVHLRNAQIAQVPGQRGPGHLPHPRIVDEQPDARYRPLGVERGELADGFVTPVHRAGGGQRLQFLSGPFLVQSRQPGQAVLPFPTGARRIRDDLAQDPHRSVDERRIELHAVPNQFGEESDVVPPTAPAQQPPEHPRQIDTFLRPPRGEERLDFEVRPWPARLRGEQSPTGPRARIAAGGETTGRQVLLDGLVQEPELAPGLDDQAADPQHVGQQLGPFLGRHRARRAFNPGPGQCVLEQRQIPLLRAEFLPPERDLLQQGLDVLDQLVRWTRARNSAAASSGPGCCRSRSIRAANSRSSPSVNGSMLKVGNLLWSTLPRNPRRSSGLLVMSTWYAGSSRSAPIARNTTWRAAVSRTSSSPSTSTNQSTPGSGFGAEELDQLRAAQLAAEAVHDAVGPARPAMSHSWSAPRPGSAPARTRRRPRRATAGRVRRPAAGPGWICPCPADPGAAQPTHRLLGLRLVHVNTALDATRLHHVAVYWAVDLVPVHPETLGRTPVRTAAIGRNDQALGTPTSSRTEVWAQRLAVWYRARRGTRPGSPRHRRMREVLLVAERAEQLGRVARCAHHGR
ncbi:hypothetical protein [Saccharopolyspora antimicrobica]|uniref:hypothetical protein n=1 Tax=Saccharopolyspora antimicrobica TaxID=455193 RepID=UPI001160C78C|nr:hypothetical protein [Saccharopolyspora antimicrobica]